MHRQFPRWSLAVLAMTAIFYAIVASGWSTATARAWAMWLPGLIFLSNAEVDDRQISVLLAASFTGAAGTHAFVKPIDFDNPFSVLFFCVLGPMVTGIIAFHLSREEQLRIPYVVSVVGCTTIVAAAIALGKDWPTWLAIAAPCAVAILVILAAWTPPEVAMVPDADAQDPP